MMFGGGEEIAFFGTVYGCKPARCSCKGEFASRSFPAKAICRADRVDRRGAKFGGGEECECIGKSAALCAEVARSSRARATCSSVISQETSCSLVPRQSSFAAQHAARQGQPVVKMSATSWMKSGSKPDAEIEAFPG